MMFLGFFNVENGNSGQGQYGHRQYGGQGQHGGQGQYGGQGQHGGQGRQPKRREAVDFKCLQMDNDESKNAINGTCCTEVFDTIETANLACSLFEECLLIGQNSDGNFELFTESDDNTVIDLENYNLSVPTIEKTETNLFYGNFDNDFLYHVLKIVLRFYNYTES